MPIWYFGWFRSSTGVYAQKYDADVKTPEGKIVVYKLTEEDSTLNLTKLIRKYPYKEIP